MTLEELLRAGRHEEARRYADYIGASMPGFINLDPAAPKLPEAAIELVKLPDGSWGLPPVLPPPL